VAANLSDEQVAALTAEEKLKLEQSLEKATVFNVSWDLQRALDREENLITNVSSLLSGLQYGSVVAYSYADEICPW
jgi:hypothetical protein